eukprot:scaffold113535_cov24-Tisochrysis_lutea.AAC.1
MPSSASSLPSRYDLCSQASRIQSRVLGPAHPHSVATLQNLTALYNAMGDTAKAESMGLLVQALQMSHQGIVE